MSMKAELQQIVDKLDNNAEWEDLVRELIRQKKLTISMREDELLRDSLSDEDVEAIYGRIHSSQSLPDDMRNTNTYTPGNATTFGMVAGVLAVVFAFVFPPISWLGAAAAVIAGLLGIVKKEEKAWIPLLLAMVSIVPSIVIGLGMDFK